MKIGVIGVGVVGGAMSKSFAENGVDLVLYDKFKKIGSFNQMIETDICFS